MSLVVFGYLRGALRVCEINPVRSRIFLADFVLVFCALGLMFSRGGGGISVDDREWTHSGLSLPASRTFFPSRIENRR